MINLYIVKYPDIPTVCTVYISLSLFFILQIIPCFSFAVLLEQYFFPLPSSYTPDVGDVGAPLQILGDGVKVHEEPGEEQNWNSCDRSNKRGYLFESAENTCSYLHV